MSKAFLFLLPVALFAKASFITPMEYASQLYKNPRGIGCQHCHGEDAKGKLIATYTHKKEDRVLSGPPLNNLEYEKFYKELNRRKRGMPRYFLTQDEIKALYLYVTKDSNKTVGEVK